MDLVTVFGGTGFLGHHIVDRLTQARFAIRIAVRQPARTSAIAQQDHVTTVQADVRDERAVAAAVAGAYGVVNAVSAYVEKRDITYPAIHETGAANVAAACARERVSRLVHISGIGADANSSSKYIRSRGLGDLAVQHAFPRAIILRPSVMFGPDDAFLNVLAKFVQSAPIVPVIGGRTQLQPVHVNDVAEMTIRTLQSLEPGAKTYELGGPEVLTIQKILTRIADRLSRRPVFVEIPLGLAHVMAQVLELLPSAPLTVAQVDLLEADNIVRHEAGLGALGIIPHSLESAIFELPAD